LPALQLQLVTTNQQSHIQSVLEIGNRLTHRSLNDGYVGSCWIWCSNSHEQAKGAGSWSNVAA
jgi:hypothetical protein